MIRKIARIVAISGLMGGLCSWAIWLRYFDTLPRQPDPISARIYARNMHGITIYQTKAEDLFLSIWSGVSYTLMASGVLVGLFEERHWRRSTGYNIPPMPKDWHPK